MERSSLWTGITMESIDAHHFTLEPSMIYSGISEVTRDAEIQPSAATGAFQVKRAKGDSQRESVHRSGRSGTGEAPVRVQLRAMSRTGGRRRAWSESGAAQVAARHRRPGAVSDPQRGDSGDGDARCVVHDRPRNMAGGGARAYFGARGAGKG